MFCNKKQNSVHLKLNYYLFSGCALVMWNNLDTDMLNLAFDTYKNRPVREDLEPVVLLHGMMETRKTWLHVAEELAKRTKRMIFAIDFRNHGGSPYSSEYGMRVLSQDLLEFLQEQGLTSIVLLGSSMGGHVAMDFATNHADKVAMLIVEDAAPSKWKHFNTNLVPEAVRLLKLAIDEIPPQLEEQGTQQYLKEYARPFMDLIRVSEKMVDTVDWRTLPLKWNGKTMVVDVNVDTIADTLMSGRLLGPISGTYEKATLFICGGRSQGRVKEDPAITKHFPKVIKTTFEKAGHFIHHEFPIEFSTEVANFINANSAVKSKI